MERTPERTPAKSGDALPPGKLRSDIQVRTASGSGKQAVSVQVGPSSETERIMRLLEYGHAITEPLARHNWKTRLAHSAVGYVIKRVAPHPVMRPAWEASQQDSMLAVIQSLQDSEGD